jgi:hypothetical protein
MHQQQNGSCQTTCQAKSISQFAWEEDGAVRLKSEEGESM